jgi:hypothetical protein
MGGCNSGSRRGRSTTNDMRTLDVRRLKREGLLKPGQSFAWSWTRNGETMARINIRVNDDSAHLSYRQSWRGEPWQDCSNIVQIEWTPCHFGGSRVWWRCPMADCRRRVAVLYSGRGLYACRYCLGLVYRSQRESPSDLAARHANKIRARLGWTLGILNMPGGRPKGMHLKTYLRLLQEHTNSMNAALSGWKRQLGTIEDRLRRTK